jgi:hypothetical protein
VNQETPLTTAPWSLAGWRVPQLGTDGGFSRRRRILVTIAANGNRDLMSRCNARALGSLSKYWTQRCERCHYGNGKDHGPAQGGPPFSTRRYCRNHPFDVREATALRAFAWTFRAGAKSICEVFGRKKSPGFHTRCQGFSAGAPKTSEGYFGGQFHEMGLNVDVPRY